jgi:hypothetical protein
VQQQPAHAPLPQQLRDGRIAPVEVEALTSRTTESNPAIVAKTMQTSRIC